MLSPAPAPIEKAAHGLPLWEFVAMMASLTAVNALGVDMMLAALPQIGRELRVAVENHQQLVITIYIGSFGVGQLLWGPIADRFGRRPVLFTALGIYAVTSFVAAYAQSFELLLVARAMQGLSSGSTRVLSSTIIRDCYEGRRMARIMSLCFMAFLATPILAPTLGQLVLLVAPWHWIFFILGGFSLFVASWAAIRLPETLDPGDRRPVNIRAVMSGAAQVLRNRISLGYTIAQGTLYGALIAFVSSAPQIIGRSFGRPELFSICFAAIVAFMIGSATINARIVERLGMRLVSHAALLVMLCLCAVRLALVVGGLETLIVFVMLSGLTFLFHGLCGSNFNSMAMEPMGHIAGTAASVQGFITTIIATLIGLAIGQSYAGTTLPITLGTGLCGLASLAVVLLTERGRLFRQRAV